MCKMLKYAIALPVLFLVLCGLLHDGCQQAVFNGTLSGLLVGLVHGPLHAYCAWERGKLLTPTRIKTIVVFHLLHDTAVGLLIGAMNALVTMVFG
jgi:hypothetical protein